MSLRLTNFSTDDKVGYFYMDSIPSIQCALKDTVKKNVEAWLADNAQGKYKVQECYESILVSFSRDIDAVMYKLGGPYA